MSDIAIKVEGLGKAYRLGVQEEKAETMVEALTNLIKAPLSNFRRLQRLNTFNTDRDSDDILWAIKDVSFEVRRGEVVGLVGRNGAGKSTLLKVISRITAPTTGQIMIRGRVSSLLEVGTGFHPELTGRENVYMNGTILGMRKHEIASKFDEIVAFSGVERFLDTPVKRYSSGMKVRLAFAVAAHLEPEVLVVDEVLAVGDADFQKKCLGKMKDVAGSGRTVLFVSHNMGAVQALCSRAIALRHGTVVDDGPSGEVVRAYLGGIAKTGDDVFSLDNPERRRSGTFRLTAGRVLDEQAQPTENVVAGRPFSIQFDYASDHNLENLSLGFSLINESGIPITHINTAYESFDIRSTGTSGTLTCTIPRNPLALGNYRVSVVALSHDQQIDFIPGALVFAVSDSIFFKGLRVPDRRYASVYIDHNWQQQIDNGNGDDPQAITPPSPEAQAA